jgi:hypothetical protein
MAARESCREAGRTKNLANFSAWPAERIAQLRAVLSGDKLLPASDAAQIVRALPRGHLLAAPATAIHIDLDTLLPRRAPPRLRDLACASDQLMVAYLRRRVYQLSVSEELGSSWERTEVRPLEYCSAHVQVRAARRCWVIARRDN